MRLWSIHPKYLDSKGLIALWREGLLAQKVLLGKTKGYKNHPQLDRFKNCVDSLVMVVSYLAFIYWEGYIRGYNFNKEKLIELSFIRNNIKKMKVTTGQLKYEFQHLQKKLYSRDRRKYLENKLSIIKEPLEAHPLFEVIEGNIESWEVL